MIWPTVTASELAAIVSEALQDAGLTAVLSGGVVVQIYSEGRHVSKDLAGLDLRLRDRIFIGTQVEGPIAAPVGSRMLRCGHIDAGNSTTGETA